MREWLKHAFAVDEPGPAEPTPAQQPAVDWLCMQIARRRLATPGVMFLEITKPLNYVGAQTMHFLRPGAWAVLGERSYAGYIHLADFLEHRGSTEYLARRVEYFEAEFRRVEKEGESVKQFVEEHMQRLGRLAKEEVQDRPA